MNVGVCGAGIFALLDCLPGMAFTLTLFRKRLRLGVRATVAVCALLVVIQVVAGSLRYVSNKPESRISTLPSAANPASNCDSP